MVDKKTLAGLSIPAGFLGGGYVMEKLLLPRKSANVELGDANVSIHLCTLNEEAFVENALKSLTDQPIYREYDGVRLIVLDSDSTDNTREIAEEYADEVWITSRGKLSSRDEGVKKDEKADIIVNADADCIYPEHWLGHILRPFHDPETVGVHGPKLSKDFLYKSLRAWWSTVIEKSWEHMVTPNSAFRRWAYFECGGLDTSVDELDRDGALNQEEEHNFKEKLENVGNIEWIYNGILSSERQQPVTLETLEDKEAIEKYEEERKDGIRF